jgi:polyferredoxin
MSKISDKQQNNKWNKLRLARRISQTVFLILFLGLIVLTAGITGGSVKTGSSIDVPYPVEAFLDIDPLAGAIVLLSTHTIPGAMIFGLIVLASGLLLGRAFCAWICPMGTMNHLVAQAAPGLRGKRRVEANRTRPYQKIKYVLLFGVLTAAIFGSAVGGLFDPICLATRGVSLTFLPWIQWALGGAVGTGMESNTGAFQQAADGIYNAVGDIFQYKRGVIVAGGFLI